MKRDVTIRVGTGGGLQTTVNGEDLYEAIDEDDGSFSLSHNEYDTLVLYRETDGHSADCGEHLANSVVGTAYARVPNYVYDYLIDAGRAYTEDEYMDMLVEQTIDFDWSADGRSSRTLDQSDERDVIVMADDKSIDPFREWDCMDEFRDTVRQSLEGYGKLDDDQEIRSITYRTDLTDYWPVFSSRGCYEVDVDEPMPSIVFLTSRPQSGITEDASVDWQVAFFDSVLADLDRGAPEWDRFEIDPQDDDTIATMRRLMDAGGFVSTDDDPDLPFEDSEYFEQNQGSKHYASVQMATDDMYMMRTLERLEAAGGFVQDESDGDVGDGTA